METSNQKLHSQVQNLRTKEQQLKAQLKDASEERVKTGNHHLEQLQATEEELKKAEQAIVELQHQLNITTEELEGLRCSTASDNNREAEERESEMAGLKDQIACLQTSLAAKEEELSHMSQEMAKLKCLQVRLLQIYKDPYFIWNIVFICFFNVFL